MTFNRKNFIIFIIVILFCLLSGYFVINVFVQKHILYSEINKIYKVDISSSRYKYDIKTSFKYSIIEKEVKGYIKDQNDTYLEVSNIMNNKKVKSILSYDNYETDGPLFDNSIQYITEVKNTINKKMDALISNSSDTYLINLVKKKGLSKYYSNLCDDLLNTDEMITYLNNNKELFTHSRDDFNYILDVELEVITFLKNNKDNWELRDKEIQFRTNDLLNQYNLLVSKIK